MGCFSHRRKQTSEIFDQKWDHIHLNDFRATGCGSHFAYAYLWFSLLLSTAVYAVDSFTAVNLLVFDRWSSEIRPAIPIDISKWIFSVCILLSFVNLGFEAVRAIRVMRRGNVAECYLDNLAVRWESIRMGEGQGYRRFLVFAELTKSKKGAEYIAIFTYFNLQGLPPTPSPTLSAEPALLTAPCSLDPRHSLLWPAPVCQRLDAQVRLPSQASRQPVWQRWKQHLEFLSQHRNPRRGQLSPSCHSLQHELHIGHFYLLSSLHDCRRALLRLLPLPLDPPL